MGDAEQTRVCLAFDDRFKKASPELKEFFLLIDKTIKSFGNDVTTDKTKTSGYIRYFRKKISKRPFLEITIQSKKNNLDIWLRGKKESYDDSKNLLMHKKKYDVYETNFKVDCSTDFDYAVSLLKQAYDSVRG